METKNLVEHDSNSSEDVASANTPQIHFNNLHAKVVTLNVLGREVAVDGGTPHAEQARQKHEEHALDPRRHGVRRRAAKVNVEHDHRDDD